MYVKYKQISHRFFVVYMKYSFGYVSSLSCVWLCNPVDCSMTGFPVHLIFLLFHTVHGVLKAIILKWFAIPFSSVLSELSTMTCPSWVAIHGMAHSFIELDV